MNQKTKFAAFTICFDPSLPWLVENYNRIRECFDHWYIIFGFTEDMWAAINQYYNSETISDKYLLPFNSCFEYLISKVKDDFILSNSINTLWDNKLQMCNAAYTQAQRDKVDFLFQLDSDEWYTVANMENFKKKMQDSACYIMNVPENKYWQNYHILDQGLWKGYPARAFKVVDGYSFLDHRPPKIGDNSIQHLCNPKVIWGNEKLCDHFCFVDPIQVELKSMFFSQIRSTHPTYSQYYHWYNEKYVPWSDKDWDKPYKYHPDDKEIILNPSLGKDNLEVLCQKYPLSANFLQSFYIKGDQ